MAAILSIAFLWGAAEATFFIVVPDLWISYVGWRHGTRPAMRAALLAAAGAVVGGALLWYLTVADPAAIVAFLLSLPGIDAAMRAAVSEAMAKDWVEALFIGGISGTPYKLFVAEAAIRAIDPLLFLAVSILARLLRFLAVGWLAAAIAARVAPQWHLPLWAVFWLLLYAAYFAMIGG
jgi:membrane protein YqaA with SNARE-associated domain